MGLSLAVQALGSARTYGQILTNPVVGRQPSHAYRPGGLDRSRGVTADQVKGGSAMTAVEVLVIGVVFITGMITGVIWLVSVASRREDRRARLSREAPDRMTLTGRFLTGLYVRRPGDDTSSYRHPGDDPAEYSGPYRDPWA